MSKLIFKKKSVVKENSVLELDLKEESIFNNLGRLEGGLRKMNVFKHSYVLSYNHKIKECDVLNGLEDEKVIIRGPFSTDKFSYFILDAIDSGSNKEDLPMEILSYLEKNKNKDNLAKKTITFRKIIYCPLISIITVVYNGGQFLEETIKSVLNQTYPNIEYLLIDGGSVDNSVETIKKYQNHVDYWISESDKGIYDAMNKGINLARGDWIGFINSGDYYDKDAINQIVSSINNTNNNIGIIHGANTYVDIDKSPLHIHFPLDRKCSVISHPSTFTKRAIFQKLGNYRTDFKFVSDLYFYLISAKDERKLFISNNLSFMRNNGITSGFNLSFSKELFIFYKDCNYSIIYAFFRAFLKPFGSLLMLKIFGRKTLEWIKIKLIGDYKNVNNY